MTAIILDIETTGLELSDGHKIVEIGMIAVDEIQFVRTGPKFHKYINPMRKMSRAAQEIHNITDSFLRDKPTFEQISDEFLEFIGNSRLVAHNAEFDISFVNSELAAVNQEQIASERVVDTLDLAKRELPTLSRHNLDALCRHYGIDNSARVKHSALLDAELLTDIFFRLLGSGRDMFAELEIETAPEATLESAPKLRNRPEPLAPLITIEEEEAHLVMVKSLGEDALWRAFKR